MLHETINERDQIGAARSVRQLLLERFIHYLVLVGARLAELRGA